jgi:hypothetical protein
MEGLHLDPGLYLYEFGRYGQAHLLDRPPPPSAAQLAPGPAPPAEPGRSDMHAPSGRPVDAHAALAPGTGRRAAHEAEKQHEPELRDGTGPDPAAAATAVPASQQHPRGGRPMAREAGARAQGPNSGEEWAQWEAGALRDGSAARPCAGAEARAGNGANWLGGDDARADRSSLGLLSVVCLC